MGVREIRDKERIKSVHLMKEMDEEMDQEKFW
jgi:hypothetical protein